MTDTAEFGMILTDIAGVLGMTLTDSVEYDNPGEHICHSNQTPTQPKPTQLKHSGTTHTQPNIT